MKYTANKDYLATLPLQFDFTNALGAGVIQGSPTLTIELLAGVDASPTNVLLGTATVNGAIVTQWLKAGVVGCCYHIRCIIVTVDGRTLVGAMNLYVLKL